MEMETKRVEMKKKELEKQIYKEDFKPKINKNVKTKSQVFQNEMYQSLNK